MPLKSSNKKELEERLHFVVIQIETFIKERAYLTAKIHDLIREEQKLRRETNGR